MPIQDVVAEPMPSTREDHFCSRYVEACDHETHYFNWLACQCLASYQCEIGCRSGTILEPQYTCGKCRPAEEIRASLYPKWATDIDIEEAADLGQRLNDARPKDWRVCPKAKKCEANQYWDELACQCFVDRECQCPVGMQTDPASDCGECLTFKQVIQRGYYPKWVTPADIALAAVDGRAKKWEQEQPRPVCPFEMNQIACNSSQYWNELSC
mmetsp:Transcript_18636/g.25133  ORF Transcript_18636/g.25133 Transcript_18636/m.25133 type:complete len:212 (-) Transcript_18636:1573-2208(-)